MGIKMKFTLLAAAYAWDIKACGDGGLGSNQDGCSKYGASRYAGSGDQCLKDACCDNGAPGGEGSGVACRYAVSACSSNYRRVLKEEDDFDSLDDLDVMDGAPGFG